MEARDKKVYGKSAGKARGKVFRKSEVNSIFLYAKGCKSFLPFTVLIDVQYLQNYNLEHTKMKSEVTKKLWMVDYLEMWMVDYSEQWMVAYLELLCIILDCY